MPPPRRPPGGGPSPVGLQGPLEEKGLVSSLLSDNSRLPRFSLRLLFKYKISDQLLTTTEVLLVKIFIPLCDMLDSHGCS